MYDAAGSQIGTSDISLQYGFCAAQLTLQAGNTYRIAVTQTWDTAVSPIALYAVRDADFLAKHGFGYENAAESTVLSGSAAEPPVVNADQLREGVDFTLTYLSNDRPGKMAAVVRGLGVCRGTVLLPMTLLGGLQEAESAAWRYRQMRDAKQ